MENSDNGRAKFRAITESTQEDWQLIGGALQRFAKKLPERLIAHLNLLHGDYGGFPRRSPGTLPADSDPRISGGDATTNMWSARCCTTSATRIGPHNHPDIAAAILQPFVSEENHWIVKHTRRLPRVLLLPFPWARPRHARAIPGASALREDGGNSAACLISRPSIPISDRCRSRPLNRYCRRCSASLANRSMSRNRQNSARLDQHNLSRTRSTISNRTALH